MPGDSNINIALENIEELEDGTFVGPSSCDEFTTALGSGQMVLSYSFYVPTGRLVSSTTRDLALLQIFRTRNPALLPIFRKARRGIRRYLSLVEELASTMAELYPGWRMRIYHNVTDQQPNVIQRLCNLYCDHQHVDLCDTRRLPTVGDLNHKFPVGRFWRFQVRPMSHCHEYVVLPARCWGTRL